MGNLAKPPHKKSGFGSGSEPTFQTLLRRLCVVARERHIVAVMVVVVVVVVSAHWAPVVMVVTVTADDDHAPVVMMVMMMMILCNLNSIERLRFGSRPRSTSRIVRLEYFHCIRDWRQ